MVYPVKGDVVVVPFPFSDLTGTKRRPALVLAQLTRDDFVLCMISSKGANDPNSVSLERGDFASGGLSVASSVRCGRLFTAEASILLYLAGKLKPEKMAEVRESLSRLFA